MTVSYRGVSATNAGTMQEELAQAYQTLAAQYQQPQYQQPQQPQYQQPQQPQYQQPQQPQYQQPQQPQYQQPQQPQYQHAGPPQTPMIPAGQGVVNGQYIDPRGSVTPSIISPVYDVPAPQTQYQQPQQQQAQQPQPAGWVPAFAKEAPAPAEGLTTMLAEIKGIKEAMSSWQQQEADKVVAAQVAKAQADREQAARDFIRTVVSDESKAEALMPTMITLLGGNVTQTGQPAAPVAPARPAQAPTQQVPTDTYRAVLEFLAPDFPDVERLVTSKEFSSYAMRTPTTYKGEQMSVGHALDNCFKTGHAGDIYQILSEIQRYRSQGAPTAPQVAPAQRAPVAPAYAGGTPPPTAPPHLGVDAQARLVQDLIRTTGDIRGGVGALRAMGV